MSIVFLLLTISNLSYSLDWESAQVCTNGVELKWRKDHQQHAEPFYIQKNVGNVRYLVHSKKEWACRMQD